MCTITVLNLFSIPVSQCGEDVSCTSAAVPVNVNVPGEEVVLALKHFLEVQYPMAIETIRATGGVYDSSFLARWLKSKQGEMEKAAASIAQHAAWRGSMFGQSRRMSGDWGNHAQEEGRIKDVETATKAKLESEQATMPFTEIGEQDLPLTICLQGIDISSRPVLLFRIRQASINLRLSLPWSLGLYSSTTLDNAPNTRFQDARGGASFRS